MNQQNQDSTQVGFVIVTVLVCAILALTIVANILFKVRSIIIKSVQPKVDAYTQELDEVYELKAHKRMKLLA